MPLNESTEIVWMKPVCVLVRRHRFEYDFAVDMLRKRQLNQNPVDLGIGVLLLDQGQQLCLRRVRWQFVIVDMDARRITGFLLALDIEMRGGIVAHQNCCQAGPHPGLSQDCS